MLLSKGLVSIIMPAYNAEDFICETLTAISKQTYLNYEVIIVNDGSIDNTIAVVESFCMSDHKVKLYSQPNGGVSAARNKGLANANGEWICFIDADDLISPDYIEQMILLANMSHESMVLTCSIVEFHSENNDSKNEYVWPLMDVQILNKDISNSVLTNKELVYVWGKLYPAKILKNNKIQFSTFLNVGEDYLFNIQVFSKIKRIERAINGTYLYRNCGNDSLSRVFNKQNILNRLNTIQFIEAYLENLPDYKYRSEVNTLYFSYVLVTAIKMAQRAKSYRILIEVLKDLPITRFNMGSLRRASLKPSAKAACFCVLCLRMFS